MSAKFGSVRRWLGRLLGGKSSAPEPRVLADLVDKNQQLLPPTYESILRSAIERQRARERRRSG